MTSSGLWLHWAPMALVLLLTLIGLAALGLQFRRTWRELQEGPPPRRRAPPPAEVDALRWAEARRRGVPLQGEASLWAGPPLYEPIRRVPIGRYRREGEAGPRDLTDRGRGPNGTTAPH